MRNSNTNSLASEQRLSEETMMPKLSGFSVVAAVLTLCVPAAAQDYPAKPIMLVVPLPPGGTNDILARVVADKMGAALGQQVVVENRAAGGSGTVASRQVAHGTADGYTILLAYTSTLGTAPSMFKNIGYDPRKDFAPIGLIASAPALLLVHPSLPVRDAKGLIAMMKASKEPFNVGTPGSGTVNYLASVLFAQQAGVKVQQIPYKGSNGLNTDLIAGHVKVGFNPIPVSRGALEGKLIRALAGTSLKRSSSLPDLPTLSEAGLPGFDATLNYGLVAPAGTPKPIIARLNAALNKALADPDVKKRIVHEGAEPEPGTPEHQAEVIDKDETKWSKIIKAAGLAPQ
jgi:tripartite-type tricarboxylate transporter receptor subunit TctC